MTEYQQFRTSRAATTADLGAALVILSLRTNRYFTLEGTGRRIWERLAEPTTVDALVREMSAGFDVEESECARDIRAFVGELVRTRLVEEA